VTAPVEDEIRKLLLNILRTGILEIRAAGWDGKAALCAIEADHLHNLPGLIGNLKPEPLKYYFNVERLAYGTLSNDTLKFASDWKRLEELMDEFT